MIFGSAHKKTLGWFFIVFVSTVAVFGQKQQYANIFGYYRSVNNFNGAVLVAADGKIEYLNGTGLSNRQNGVRLTSKSKFRIASVTKTFTAVLVLQLVEQGKIELKAPISRYLPEYRGAGRDQITIHHLLTYSSGLDNVDQRETAIYNTKASPDSLIEKYFSGNLVSVPGEKFSYKNADYILLGKIIEKITGKPFRTVLMESILDPLSMKSTGYLENGDVVIGLASSYLYDKSSGVFRNDDPYWIDNFYAAGAMYSTVEDLLKFNQAIFDYRILNKKSVNAMLDSRPELAYVGYGFWISPVKFGAVTARAADRQGSIAGSNASWIHLIEQKKTVIVFSNTNATDINELREKMMLAALGQKVELPEASKSVTGDE